MIRFADKVRRDRQRYRRSRSGAQTSHKPVIYWDNARNKYVVKTPYNEKYIQEIKTLLDTSVYLGSTEKAWSVDEIEIDLIKTVVSANFGDFDFVPKPEANFNMSAAGIDGAASAALEIFKLAGKDATFKAKRVMSQEFHPDKNKAPGANEIMASINAAFDKLIKEMGW